MKTPEDCTSLYCSARANGGCDYCKKCSHARFLGQGVDRNGKVWRWEFNRQFGPLFLCKDMDTPLARQPISQRHPAWEPFERWLREWDE